MLVRQEEMCSIYQSSKKLGSWDLDSQTIFLGNPDIFGLNQKSETFVDILHIFLLKLRYNLMAIDHKRKNRSFKTVFIQKNLICELINELGHFYT
jgi:hypothetical protein